MSPGQFAAGRRADRTTVAFPVPSSQDPWPHGETGGRAFTLLCAIITQKGCLVLCLTHLAAVLARLVTLPLPLCVPLDVTHPF